VARQQWRVRSASLRGMPAFIIIGAQRSGTTSSYDWLSRHPEVAPATHKELHYFDGKNYELGESWYRSQFPILRSGQITGESSPQMLYNPMSPKWASNDLPASTRFVALLRNPTQRAISHYWFSKSRGNETEDLPTALSLEKERLAAEQTDFDAGRHSYAHHKFSYAARGEYAGQIKRWYEHVDPERILILEGEGLCAEREKQVELTEWLGLKPHSEPIPSLNAAARSDIDPAIIENLNQHFEPLNEQLFELLGYRLWGQ